MFLIALGYTLVDRPLSMLILLLSVPHPHLGSSKSAGMAVIDVERGLLITSAVKLRVVLRSTSF